MASLSTSAIARDIGGTFSRRELFLWLLGLLLANLVFRFQGGNTEELLAYVSDMLGGRSIFHYIAGYAVLNQLLSSDGARPAQRGDLLFVVAIAVFNLLPPYTVVWLSATIAALYMLVRSDGDEHLAASGAVLLAISLNGFWGPHLFDFFAPYVLRADAALVGTLLSATHGQIVWRETLISVPGGQNIIVFGPCSSFHNISLGLLGWVSITKLLRTRWVRSDFAVAAVIVATVIVLNAARLTILALGPDDFEYWHLGGGASLFAWVTTLAVLGISIWGAIRVAQPG